MKVYFVITPRAMLPRIPTVMPDVMILSVSSNKNPEQNSGLQAMNALSRGGFEARICTQVKELFAALDDKINRIIVLDVVQADDVDGFQMTSILRASFKAQILLFVGPSPAERARGLDSGADICLSIPIQPVELVAAVSAMQRRMNEAASAGPLSKPPQPSLAAAAQPIWVLEMRGWRLRAPNGAVIKLTANEREFMLCVSQDAEQTVRMHEWNDANQSVDKKLRPLLSSSMKQTASHLRRKVGAIYKEFPLHARRGVGYQFGETCLVMEGGRTPADTLNLASDGLNRSGL